MGHAWDRTRFVAPLLEGREAETRFIPARVNDNAFNNPEYRKVLEALSGWQKRAWLNGDLDIAAGQYFTSFRREVHIVQDFDDTRAVEWFAALDYGFATTPSACSAAGMATATSSSWTNTRSGCG